MDPENTARFAQMLPEERRKYMSGLPDGIVHRRPGSMQDLIVIKEGSPVQMVFHGGRSRIIQSEMEIEKPLVLFDGFTQASTLVLLWRPEVKRVLLIGFGGGRIATVLHHCFPELVVECAEIDRDVVEVAGSISARSARTQELGSRYRMVRSILQNGAASSVWTQ